MSALLKFALRAQSLLRSLLMLLCRVFPIRDNKAVFVSFGGRAYSDSPKAVSEALHALKPGADIVWLCFDPAERAPHLPDYARLARTHSPRALYELATARAWVDNMPKPLYTRKRNGQFYIQTWHGDRGFKKMLYDAPDHPAGKPVLEQDIADLLTSGSEFCERTYRTGFNYRGEILKQGSPRNDLLMNGDTNVEASTRDKLGLLPGDKVLLYAPTMRNASRRRGVPQPIQRIDLPRTLDSLDARFGGQFKCVVRCHSTSLGLGGLPDDPRIIDASGYEDMADLLLISDVLITDYSSSAGDFALAGRPVILFQQDRGEFERDERTFYFDIDQSPYVVVMSQRELEAHIAGLTPESARANCRAILDFYGAYETGRAAIAAAKRIAERMR